MLINMICLVCSSWRTKECALTQGGMRLDEWLLNRRKGLNALLSLKPRGLFISFARTKKKKRNKDELLRTMSEKNSPSALFGLLRQVFPLNKKNSLRSNSFLFLTLQHSPPLHAQKVRPDLHIFYSTLLRSLGVFVYFLLRLFSFLLLFLLYSFSPFSLVIQSGTKCSEGSRVHPLVLI